MNDHTVEKAPELRHKALRLKALAHVERAYGDLGGGGGGAPFLCFSHEGTRPRTYVGSYDVALTLTHLVRYDRTVQ
eukprot:SAG25_NODE_854_length_5065_cov_2.899690_1_plen_76_part_00